jgi:predicted MFS family arabinose efflux permease
LGGLLYQAVGGLIVFLLDALSYFINAISLLFINIPLGGAVRREQKAVYQEIKEAAVWFWQQPVLRFLNLLTAGRTILAASLYLLIIVLAKEQDTSAVLTGAIFALGAGGGILGSLVSAKIHDRFPMKTLLVGVSSASFAVFSLYAFAVHPYLIAGITALYYAVDPLYNVTTSTYSARTIPDEIRGRVVSLTRLVVLGAHSFGFFITGISLQYVGTQWTIRIFACLLFILLFMTVLNKRLSQS